MEPQEARRQVEGEDEDDRSGERLYLLAIASFLIGGCIVYGVRYFPELPLWRTIIASVMFGIFCTMVAATHRLMD